MLKVEPESTGGRQVPPPVQSASRVSSPPAHHPKSPVTKMSRLESGPARISPTWPAPVPRVM
eukprot:1962353-Rhodomonas_salina.3